MAAQVVPFPELDLLRQDAVHGAYRTQASPGVEQRGVDSMGSGGHNACSVQRINHRLAFLGSQF